MNKSKKIFTALSVAAILFSMTACEEPLSEPVETSAEASAETAIDMEQAMAELDEYCSHESAYVRFDNYFYDFTGDGNDDIITSYMYGSGIVRHIIVLYDVANQEFYSLGDDDNAYFIISFEDGHLTAGTYSGNNEITGTVEFIDNELVFSRDS